MEQTLENKIEEIIYSAKKFHDYGPMSAMIVDIEKAAKALATFIEQEKRKAFEAAREENVYADSSKNRGRAGGQTITSAWKYPDYESYREQEASNQKN